MTLTPSRVTGSLAPEKSLARHGLAEAANPLPKIVTHEPAAISGLPEAAFPTLEITGGASGIITTNASVRVSLLPELSVTRAVKLKRPPTVGVPAMAPASFNVNPAGNDRVTSAQTSLPDPPEASSFNVERTPTVSPTTGDEVTIFRPGGSGATVSVNSFDAVFPALSVTSARKFTVPEPLAVPEIDPSGLKVNPGNSGDPAPNDQT